MVTQIVAGMKLKKKHMGAISLGNTHNGYNTRNVREMTGTDLPPDQPARFYAKHFIDRDWRWARGSRVLPASGVAV